MPSGHAERKGKKLPTLSDVAAKAGVSKATVSNVLNRPEKVTQPRRNAVLSAINELGYRCNEHAVSLRKGETSPRNNAAAFTDGSRSMLDSAAEAQNTQPENATQAPMKSSATGNSKSIESNWQKLRPGSPWK